LHAQDKRADSPATPSLTADKPADFAPIPLTVEAGVPLHIALDQKVAIKQAGVAIVGHVIEPVYVFDHLMILSLATIPSDCEINDMKARMRIRSAITLPLCSTFSGSGSEPPFAFFVRAKT
jgi:hypothetical protein